MILDCSFSFSFSLSRSTQFFDDSGSDCWVLLKDTGEGHNEYNDNPAQETETSSGAYTTARKASISPDLTNNSTRDRVSCDIYTEPPSSHNSN